MVYSLRDGRVQGVLLWNVWEQSAKVEAVLRLEDLERMALMRTLPQLGICGLLHVLERLEGVDIVRLCSPLAPDNHRVLFRGSEPSWRTVGMNRLAW